MREQVVRRRLHVAHLRHGRVHHDGVDGVRGGVHEVGVDDRGDEGGEGGRVGFLQRWASATMDPAYKLYCTVNRVHSAPLWFMNLLQRRRAPGSSCRALYGMCPALTMARMSSAQASLSSVTAAGG